jgi:hypothetical protein
VLEWAQPAAVVGLAPQLGAGAVEGQDPQFDFHYPTFYDGILQIFALLTIKRNHDVWKHLKKTQKMSSF